MRFHRTTTDAANSGNHVVGTGILGGDPPWIEVELIDLPQVGGRGITGQTRNKRCLGAPGHAVRGGQHKVAARRVHHRACAHVHGAAVDEDCANAGVGVHRARDLLRLGLANLRWWRATPRYWRGSDNCVMSRLATRRQQRHQANQRAKPHRPNAHRSHHA